MSDTAAIQRQLKIKSGVVQRLAKEVTVYDKETAQLGAKLAKFKSDGAEEWDIKNAGKMVDESKKMIADATSRLGKAVEDLQGLITSTKEESALPSDDEALTKAEKVLKEATSGN